MLSEVHAPTALKMHSFGLTRIFNPIWTGLDLYYHLKVPVRSGKLFHKPVSDGFLPHLGRWIYHEYIFERNLDDERALVHLDGENRLWYLLDLVDFLLYHGADETNSVLERCGEYGYGISDLYETDEKAYFNKLRSTYGCGKISFHCELLRQEFRDLINSLAPAYAIDYANRVFHDRELCGFIVETIRLIGYGKNLESEPERWFERKAWPQWTIRVVQERDRGHCAECGRNLGNEPQRAPHVDHIIPLARGGTNDLVNLQLLCQDCNLRKGVSEKPVRSSIPSYYSVRRK